MSSPDDPQILIILLGEGGLRDLTVSPISEFSAKGCWFLTPAASSVPGPQQRLRKSLLSERMKEKCVLCRVPAFHPHDDTGVRPEPGKGDIMVPI